MGFTAKAKSNSNSEGWGLGFFLVFFPDNEQQSPPPTINNNSKNTPTISNSFKSTPINNTATPPPPPPLTRRPTSASSNPLLLSKAQSTITICSLLVFLSLLFFTLSSFEPTTTTAISTRRHLSSSTNPKFLSKPNYYYQNTRPHSSYALQGLGNLYRKGTRAMNDLIVGHVIESVTEQELRLFLRLFYKSSLSSKSDLLFIFPSSTHSSAFESVIFQETESFFKLLNRTQFVKPIELASSDENEFLKSSKKEKEKEKERGETIWGRGIRSENRGENNETESTRASYGSVVSFVVDELDPENSLSGFLDHVLMSMRRWACYPMLLGRVRRNFKHVMLVDVREVLLLGDPLSRIRSRSPETVQLLSTEAVTAHTSNKQHGKKNSVKQTQSQKPVNSAVVMGGARGVRRLSNAMLTEIVRVTTQHKKKNAVTESGLFNHLVGNEFILKNVNVVTSTESVPEVSSLTGVNSNSGSSLSLSNYSMVRRGNSNSDSTSILMKHVCGGLEVNSSIYSDCL